MSKRMGNSFRKFLLLIWKNTYVIRKRHWVVTIMEIIIPLFLFVLMVMLRANVSAFNAEVVKEPTYFPEISETELLDTILVGTSIIYAPKNKFSTEIVTRFKKKCGLYSKGADGGFASEEALIDYYNMINLNKNYSSNELVAIIFEGEAAREVEDFPKKLQYKFRLNSAHRLQTEALYTAFSVPGPAEYNDKYIPSGFSILQLCLDKSFIEMAREKVAVRPFADLQDKIFLQKMPYPPYLQDYGYSSIAKYLLPSLAVYSFITLCVAVVKRVVEEKQTGVRELMRLMGMEPWAMWASWLVDALLVRLISLALVVVLLKVEISSETGAVLKSTDGSVLYFMLLMYTVAAVCSCFLITTFFSKPTLAMCTSILLWILSAAIPPYIIEHHGSDIHIKRLFCLLPNMGLYYIFHIAIDFESKGIGAQWSYFFSSPSGQDSELSLAGITLMFIISSVLYSVLTWYVSSISPGKFGVAKPWYFVFTQDYWMPGSTRTRLHDPEWNIDSEQDRNFERPLSKNFDEPNVGVFIRDLSKTYDGLLGKPPIKAVRGLSLDLYKGEMTALLGHNGAGKTTTMSILTGMIASSGGSVQVLGYDLATELPTVRSSLGLCPQHNMLFKDLTVREHLIFFAMMKGNSRKLANLEAQELVEQVNLKDKWNKNASTLSGGMKRKLSLAIALIGGSRVLVLDEPTSGLDPEARRDIWDLLLSMRGERTILLSTHFMEEADVLGDTIAIMSHGKVHCCGAGYHMTILRKPDCDVESITKLVMSAVPEAEVSDTGTDQTDGSGECPRGPITFRLPSNSTHKFVDMLDKLEHSKDQLGIANVSMSVTTMEEVFLKVGKLADRIKTEEIDENFEESDCVDNTQPTHVQNLNTDCERNGSMEALKPLKNEGWKLVLQQMWALVLKKLLFTQRRWVHLVFKIVVTVLLMVATIFLSRSTIIAPSDTRPKLALTLKAYGESKDIHVLYSSSSSVEARRASEFYDHLTKKMASVKKVELADGGVLKGLLKEAAVNEITYREKYIAAASFNETSHTSLHATAIFSTNALHSNPISVNLVTNSLLALRTGDFNYSIEVSTHPFPNDSPYQHLTYHEVASAAVTIIWLSVAPLGWLFIAGDTIILPLQERICGARQLQVMSGVSYWMVWLSYLLVDVAINTAIAIFVVTLVPLLDSNSTFSGPNEIGVLFLLFFLYGISGTAFAYVMSFSKNTTAGAYAYFILVSVIIGLVVNTIVFVLEYTAVVNSGLDTTVNIFRYLFGLLIPHSALTSAFAHFGSTATYNSKCRNLPENVKDFVCTQSIHHLLESNREDLIACCEKCKLWNVCFERVPYLSWPNTNETRLVQKNGPILLEVVFLLFGCLWLVIVYIIDTGVVARAKECILSYLETKLHPKDETDSTPLDDDVQQEYSRVTETCKTGSQTDTILAVQGLAKDFGLPITHSRFHAVQGITFAVRPGECFGLLGVNGAGKTTTFRMLTGAEVPTQGDAMLRNIHLKRNRHLYLKDLGYCPQFDAQLDVFTGRETLALYANLRGLPYDTINRAINKWFSMLGLTEYGSRLTSSYSGGNRRKLSAAMALIGEPPLTLLDEPTSGVDPIARRRLWQVLARCQRSGQAIVLTSHSMDECEALCNRLGIMVSGQLKCLGPIAHLKNRFGQGFTVLIKVRTASWSSTPDHRRETGQALRQLQHDIEELLYPCNLHDQHQGILHYHVTDTKKRWSELFSVMEELKRKHSNILEDYTLSETTLEQVFLSFARGASVARSEDGCVDINSD